MPGKQTEQFLLAAKQAEILTLQRLADTCQTVSSISDLVHHLQRERGLSNVYLASNGERLKQARIEQAHMSVSAENTLRQLLVKRYLKSPTAQPSPRLLSTIAFVMQGLDDHQGIRELIDRADARKVNPPMATHAFSRLISGLLAIVFEAADSAGDAAVSRCLTALLNFMQGKEYAGQERAWAAIGLAQGVFEEELKERLMDLKIAQERTFGLFEQFTSNEQLATWQGITGEEFTKNLESLRQLIQRVSNKDTISPEISEVWYELATQRIDAMHNLELTLCSDLLRVCKSQQETVEQHLSDQQNTLAHMVYSENSNIEQQAMMLLGVRSPLGAEQQGNTTAATDSSDSSAPANKSVYDLLHEQAQHLEQTRKELEDTRRALSERKLVERAKSLLMKSLQLSEDDAYRRLQQRAMDSNLRLGEVSQIVITTIEATQRKSGQ